MSSQIFADKEQFWSKLIVIISVVVPVLVALLFRLPQLNLQLPFDVMLLPKFHAIINGTVTVLLMASYYFIRNKQVRAHKICNITALVLSALFLVSYVTYHTLTESTKFGGEGMIKYVYYFILLTHIILAALILPLILFTFLRAFSGKFTQHRSLARYTMPLWLYVSVTGVIVYLMISPYY
ncbi:MAG TPA: DUF420 domain-containing protein [Chitinophagales bacterium]|nr:DUF420 domain-containing protein [Chitinophagales bacterium]HRK26676.1 DUF420 domain-containing protein [Chitinophagales bacterium]